MKRKEIIICVEEDSLKEINVGENSLIELYTAATALTVKALEKARGTGYSEKELICIAEHLKMNAIELEEKCEKQGEQILFDVVAFQH